MITDNQTNFLYLADTLPKMYPEFFKRFEKLLTECKIKFALLPNTNDVWAVDYMPIQLEMNKFAQFKYPPYISEVKKYQHTMSDVDAICKEIGIKATKYDIKLDGGNIVHAKTKVIMTERVFKDNKNIERNALITKLHEALQVEDLFFIPPLPFDFTGHADGMVRFLDDNRILINDFSGESSSFQKTLESAIKKTGLDCITIPYNISGNKTNEQVNGAYINYLQLGSIVFVPTFGIKEDDMALKLFERQFAGQKVVSIECNEIANDGGILNCISWNIKK